MADAYSQAIGVALNDAKSMLGKNEAPNRAEIMQYLHDGGQDLDPHKVAWCAAFVSASLQKAGLPVPTQVVKDSAFGPGAYAPNYLSYGNAVEPKNIQAGDILVSNDGHHVGFAEGPIRNGANGPEVQLLAGNEADTSGRFAPGSYTNPTTGAVANRSQVGQVGERWVPLSQYSARRYVPTDNSASAAPAASSSSTASATPAQSNALTLPTQGYNAGQYQSLIDAAAKKYNIDPVFLNRTIQAESNFDPKATSPAGAQGIAQFMPATAKRYGVDVNDPASSIDGAAHYLSDNLARYNGNYGLASAGYNWGEGNVDKWLAGGWKVPNETVNYVNKITGHSMDEWKTGTSAPSTATASASPVGTTLNTTGKVGDWLASDQGKKFEGAISDFDKALGGRGLGDQQGQGQQGQEIKPSPMIEGPGVHWPSMMAAMMNQAYGTTLNSTSAPGASGYQSPAGTSQIGGGPGMASTYGTSLNSLGQAFSNSLLASIYGGGGYG